MTGIDRELVSAWEAVSQWQQHITDNPYNPNSGSSRLKDQQGLVRAALTSASNLVEIIVGSMGGEVRSVLERMPLLKVPITAQEFDHPTLETDQCVHSALCAAGTNRAVAMEFAWWHLLSLRLLSVGNILEDPPGFLLGRNAPANLPFRRESLDEAHDRISDSERKDLDTAIRNLIRRAGGIWHRPSHLLVDAPLAAGWWRIEIITAAVSASDLDKTIAHEALAAGWRSWTDVAARNSTRLTAPNCVAAYVYAAKTHFDVHDTWPKGRDAKRIVFNLMRRTQNLSVHHIDPKSLAELGR